MTTTDPSRPEYFSQLNLATVVAQATLAGRFRWALGLGWLGWDCRVWSECPDEVPVDAVRLWMLDQVRRAVDDLRQGRASDETAVKLWLGASRNASSLHAIVRLARGAEGVITEAAAFDADPDVLNVGNGVIDLTTGLLMPHSPDRLITKLAPVDYVPGATHPDWAAALEAIPADVRDYMQVRLGQALSGHMTPDDVLVVQTGGGENGKTTIMSAVAAVLGDYYLLVSDRVLLADPSAHPTELRDLRGVRLAVIEETPEARQLSVARLKKVVGVPEITARHIRQDSVTFKATHSLFLSSNYVPIVAESDHGTWRRLLLVKYPFRFRKAHEALDGHHDRRGDPTLRDRVTNPEVGAAVLSWLVTGCTLLYKLGGVMPQPPAQIVADTLVWRTEADHVLGYIRDRLVLDPGRHVLTSDLRADINSWLGNLGHNPWSEKLLASRFGGHDELAGRVMKKRLHRKGNEHTVSRPADAWGVVPDMYTGWVGCRFRTLADDASEQLASPPTPQKTGPVQLVQGASHNPNIDLLHGGI